MVEDWGKVLFSYEITVKLSMERHARDYIWRDLSEELYPDCIDYGRRLKGVGLMFWSMFRKGKIGPGGIFNLEDRQTTYPVESTRTIVCAWNPLWNILS